MMAASPRDLNEYQTAVENLKQSLKERGLTYRQLAEGIGLSESGVKKIFLSRDGSFQRLAQICHFIGISLGELIKDDRSTDVDFTDRQQKEFLKEPLLFHLFWLLTYERLHLSAAQAALRLNKTDAFHLLRRLDQLDLIKLLPGERLRIPSIKAVRWVGDGEFLRSIYRDWSLTLVKSLAQPRVSGDDFFLIRYLQMTPKTYAEFKTALRDLEEEFVRRSIHEMRTQSSRVEHVRWLVAADNRSFVTGDTIGARNLRIKEKQ